MAERTGGPRKFKADPSAPLKLGRLTIPHPARCYAVAMAFAYLYGGILGIVSDPYLHNELAFRTFIINGPHSIFHVAIGLLAIGAILTKRDFAYARAMSLVFAILSVCGFLQQPLFGIITLSGADMFLHGFTAILGDAVARMEEKELLEEEIAEIEGEVVGIEGEVAALEAEEG